MSTLAAHIFFTCEKGKKKKKILQDFSLCASLCTTTLINNHEPPLYQLFTKPYLLPTRPKRVWKEMSFWTFCRRLESWRRLLSSSYCNIITSIFSYILCYEDRSIQILEAPHPISYCERIRDPKKPIKNLGAFHEADVWSLAFYFYYNFFHLVF